MQGELVGADVPGGVVHGPGEAQAGVVHPQQGDHVVLVHPVPGHPNAAYKHVAAVNGHAARKDLNAVGQPLGAAEVLKEVVRVGGPI